MTRDRHGLRHFIHTEARAFRIWREGKPLNWKCTARELADVTGLHPDYVRRICKSRGWPIQTDYDAPLASGHRGATRRWNPAVDQQLARLF